MERFRFTLPRDGFKRQKGSGNRHARYARTDREMYEQMAIDLPLAAAKEGLIPVAQPDYVDNLDRSLTANVKVRLISSGPSINKE